MAPVLMLMANLTDPPAREAPAAKKAPVYEVLVVAGGGETVYLRVGGHPLGARALPRRAEQFQRVRVEFSAGNSRWARVIRL